MAQDPYSEWLGLPDGPRPPAPHVLLGLDDPRPGPNAVEDAAHHQLAQLDAYADHPDPALRQTATRLMNEVAQARNALMPSARTHPPPTPAPDLTPQPARSAVSPTPPRRLLSPRVAIVAGTACVVCAAMFLLLRSPAPETEVTLASKPIDDVTHSDLREQLAASEEERARLLEKLAELESGEPGEVTPDAVERAQETARLSPNAAPEDAAEAEDDQAELPVDASVASAVSEEPVSEPTTGEEDAPASAHDTLMAWLNEASDTPLGDAQGLDLARRFALEAHDQHLTDPGQYDTPAFLSRLALALAESGEAQAASTAYKQALARWSEDMAQFPSERRMYEHHYDFQAFQNNLPPFARLIQTGTLLQDHQPWGDALTALPPTTRAMALNHAQSGRYIRDRETYDRAYDLIIAAFEEYPPHRSPIQSYGITWLINHWVQSDTPLDRIEQFILVAPEQERVDLRRKAIASLHKLGRTTDAADYLERLRDETPRTQRDTAWGIAVAKSQLTCGQTDAALQTTSRTWKQLSKNLGRENSTPVYQATAIAELFYRCGQDRQAMRIWDKASNMARALERESPDKQPFYPIASSLIRQGLTERAMVVLRGESQAEERDQVLRWLAFQGEGSTTPERIDPILKAYESPVKLINTVAVLTRRDDEEIKTRAPQYLNTALAAWRQMDRNDKAYESAGAELAQALARAGMTREALDVSQKFGTSKGGAGDHLRSKIACYVAAYESRDVFDKVVNQITRPELRSRAVFLAVTFLAESGNPAAADLILASPFPIAEDALSAAHLAIAKAYLAESNLLGATPHLRGAVESAADDRALESALRPVISNALSKRDTDLIALLDDAYRASAERPSEAALISLLLAETLLQAAEDEGQDDKPPAI